MLNWKDAHTCFINLDHRTDRLARMTKVLAGLGIQASRSEGYRGRKFLRKALPRSSRCRRCSPIAGD